MEDSKVTKQDFIDYDEAKQNMYGLLHRISGKVMKIHKIFYDVYKGEKPYIQVSYMDLGINEVSVDDNGFLYEVLAREEWGYDPSIGSDTRFIPFEVLEMTDEEIKDFFRKLKKEEVKEMEDEKIRNKEIEKTERRQLYEKLRKEFEDES